MDNRGKGGGEKWPSPDRDRFGCAEFLQQVPGWIRNGRTDLQDLEVGSPVG